MCNFTSKEDDFVSVLFWVASVMYMCVCVVGYRSVRVFIYAALGRNVWVNFPADASRL